MSIRPKFSDCKDCRFFNRISENPVCRECGAGEFFDERIRISNPSKNELMDSYKKDYVDE